MKLLLVTLAFLACGVLAREADGAEKAPKPVVCVSYTVAKSDSGPVGICYDNKRPFILQSFSEVEIAGKEGGKVRALVGWR